ncbi:MAG: RNA-guided pseudouridylation complex pseudouridine synthase subunit Cbf5 [Candidatus Methanoliparum thermophilum]|uniref:Probable tRNA pseudouridine synthase B n=1 Tax=Methanoliparum thermophilum TaxID=2491083 RepID=A0A520KTT6_METT2|nr:RNA-guided pseudouridylation complex pseudouridine synthase subunit Cbf5 [Candidatus Methanoliparum sp. LAM-1]RZN65503.1 MAG: RNA-guided pseudouridylation complex pseudouridine synthase subunit Cbf5 [Candidatus Methanoliparum thermophilum]BDC35402.1 tRNA pseudouridine(55) synthase TruB [Candidatus Methanoliparum sp. LAM-1]
MVRIEEYLKRGVINLDKPPGPTSHEVSAWIRKIFNLNKVGHGGTLDPQATGVLPILLEDATKITPFLLSSNKEYVCLMKLHKKVSQKKLLKAFSRFEGIIYQKPPLKSAVKRITRKRRIYKLVLLEIEDKDVLFKVKCESGVYIRVLCHDIGKFLNVGASMYELRRTLSEPFVESDSVTMHDLVDSYFLWKECDEEKYLREKILPIEDALKHIPKIYIKDSTVDAICHGADLAAPGIVDDGITNDISAGDLIVLYTKKEEAVALAISKRDIKRDVSYTKGIIADTKRVIMQPDTYPKCWKKAGVAEW